MREPMGTVCDLCLFRHRQILSEERMEPNAVALGVLSHRRMVVRSIVDTRSVSFGISVGECPGDPVCCHSCRLLREVYLVCLQFA